MYRRQCLSSAIEFYGDDLASASDDLCRCSAEALRDNLTYDEFSQYQKLHAESEESRIDLLPQSAIDAVNDCNPLIEDAFRAFDWYMNRESDALTGAERLTVNNYSYDHDIGPLYEDDPAIMFVQCAGGSSLRAGVYMAGYDLLELDSGNVRVAYRFDQNPVVNDYWLESPEFEHQFAVLPDHAELEFIRLLDSSDELVLRVWSLGTRVGTATFRLAGSTVYFRDVLQECGH